MEKPVDLSRRAPERITCNTKRDIPGLENIKKHNTRFGTRPILFDSISEKRNDRCPGGTVVYPRGGRLLWAIIELSVNHPAASISPLWL